MHFLHITCIFVLNQYTKYMNTQDFSQLFSTHEHQLFLFARSLTRSETEARDVVQETAIRAFKNIKELDDKSKFKSWAATILHRLVINQYRKRSRRRELLNRERGLTGHFFNHSSCENKGFENLKEADLIKLTKNVGAESMQAFMLYFKGHSYKEIAEKLQIAIGTVKSRIHFARSKMKQIAMNHGIAA